MIVVADRLPAEVVGGETLALDVHVVSDVRTPIDGLEITAVLTWTGGEQRWRFGGTVAADTVARVGTLQVEVRDSRPGPFTLELVLSGDAIPVGPSPAPTAPASRPAEPRPRRSGSAASAASTLRGPLGCPRTGT